MANPTDERLKLLFERIERLEEEKKGIADDIKDVYAEAKAVGYDTKIMKAVRKLMKMKPDDRAEYEVLLDTYKAAVGLDFGDTPLGRSMVERAGEHVIEKINAGAFDGDGVTVRAELTH